MQAVSTALNQVLEAGSWFTRARELAVLVVRTSGDLRKPALQILAGLEFHHDNRSAWMVLEDAHTKGDTGWRVRANRLFAHWEDRRKVFRERESIEMPVAAPVALAPSAVVDRRVAAAIAPMREACASLLGALRPPLEGFVWVLAPAVVEDLEVMGREIEALAVDPALRRCRWVWVIEAGQPWPSALERLGPAGVRCECIPDPGQQKRDLDALLAGPPTMIGRAGPRGVTPPKRIDDPPPMPREERDAVLREAGLDPAYCDKAPELQRRLFGAAIAMKDGKGEEAVRLQGEARDLAASLNLHHVTVLCQIALASYLSGLGRSQEALAELRRAAELAQQHQLGLPEAQAHLAMALLLALGKRFPEAAAAYVTCARRSEAAKVPVLAIEAWRMGGQIHLQTKEDEAAARCFQEAIRVAEGSEVDAVKNSTASEVARKLGELYRRLGVTAQADSLFELADAMERGEVGVAAGNPQGN